MGVEYCYQVEEVLFVYCCCGQCVCVVELVYFLCVVEVDVYQVFEVGVVVIVEVFVIVFVYQEFVVVDCYDFVYDGVFGFVCVVYVGQWVGVLMCVFSGQVQLYDVCGGVFFVIVLQQWVLYDVGECVVVW